MPKVASQPLRVLIVNTSVAPDIMGGAERSIDELATALRRQGHAVLTVALGRRTDRQAQSENHAIRIPSRAYEELLRGGRGIVRKSIWHFTEFLRLGTALQLRRVIRENQPDIIHLNNLAGFGWLAWSVSRNVPTVQTLRDYALLCTSATGQHDDRVCNSTSWRCRILKWPFKLRSIQPDLATAVSRYTASRYQGAGVADRFGRVETIYNAPGEGDIDVSPRRTRDSSVVIGFIGRVALDKGIGVLLESMRDERIVGSARLMVAGPISDDDRSSIESAYADLLADSIVTLTGPMPAAEFFAAVDIVAVPTQWNEPFGRVAAEALLARRKLVYSKAGGLPEVVDLYGGESVAVEAFQSPAAWAEAMTAAITGECVRTPRPSAPRLPLASAYVAAYHEAIRRHQDRNARERR
ncbi:glycosyltransferase [Microbacterium sp. A93]|uniref:glycosyltransferase n=1 Tax=Microbacterium sp. A93 TaxID=3450716 RepID=UPI003F43C071